jgi:protein SCO1/2
VSSVSLIALLALFAFAEGCRHRTSLPYYVDASRTPVWLAPSDASTAHRVGDFALLDQRDARVSRASVQGKVYVASFFYAECKQLCPKLRSQLARVATAFAGDTNVLILSHTIAPEADGVAVLDRYARANAIDGRRWRLLTGSRTELERLARDAYLVELGDSGGKTIGRLLHTETFALVDADGHIRGLYDGSLPFDVSRLIEDIRILRG